MVIMQTPPEFAKHVMIVPNARPAVDLREQIVLYVLMDIPLLLLLPAPLVLLATAKFATPYTIVQPLAIHATTDII